MWQETYLLWHHHDPDGRRPGRWVGCWAVCWLLWSQASFIPFCVSIYDYQSCCCLFCVLENVCSITICCRYSVWIYVDSKFGMALWVFIHIQESADYRFTDVEYLCGCVSACLLASSRLDASAHSDSRGGSSCTSFMVVRLKNQLFSKWMSLLSLQNFRSHGNLLVLVFIKN